MKRIIKTQYFHSFALFFTKLKSLNPCIIFFLWLSEILSTHQDFVSETFWIAFQTIQSLYNRHHPAVSENGIIRIGKGDSDPALPAPFLIREGKVSKSGPFPFGQVRNLWWPPARERDFPYSDRGWRTQTLLREKYIWISLFPKHVSVLRFTSGNKGITWAIFFKCTDRTHKRKKSNGLEKYLH